MSIANTRVTDSLWSGPVSLGADSFRKEGCLKSQRLAASSTVLKAVTCGITPYGQHQPIEALETVEFSESATCTDCGDGSSPDGVPHLLQICANDFTFSERPFGPFEAFEIQELNHSARLSQLRLGILTHRRIGDGPKGSEEEEDPQSQDSGDDQWEDHDNGSQGPDNHQPEGQDDDHSTDENSDLQKALIEYKRAFPSGHIIVETSGENLLCGFAAVINTIASMHWDLPIPTMPDLITVFNSPAMQQHQKEFGLTNENYFHVDQVAVTLFFWGLHYGLNLQVGYFPEGEQPQLVPHQNDQPRTVVWIHHVKNASGVGHYSGMRPSPCPVRFS